MVRYSRGRESGLKIRTGWVRIPRALPLRRSTPMAEGGHSKCSMYWFESNVRHHFVEKVIQFFQQTYAHLV